MYKRSRYNLGERKQVEYYHSGSLGEVKEWIEYPGKRRDVFFLIWNRSNARHFPRVVGKYMF